MDAVSTLASHLRAGVDGAGAMSPGSSAPTAAAGAAGAALQRSESSRGEPPVAWAIRPGDGAESLASPAPSSWDDRRRELDARHRGLRVRRYRSLLLHWLGRWFRRPAAVTAEALGPVREGEVAITFIGHASILLRYRGLAVALDPMLGTWAGGVKRAVAPGVTPSDLADVELVLISHRHADHLHLPTLAALPKRATVVVPAGAAAEISPLGFSRVVELRPGAAFDLRGLTVSASALDHGDAELAAGLAYSLEGLGPSLYFCADSAYHPGFAELGKARPPDIAFLPIGGFWPRSFRRRHMSPLDALAAFEDLAARAIVPIHHGAFALSYERLDEPLRLLLEAAAQRGVRDYVLSLAPGQTEAFALEPNPAATQATGSGSAGGPSAPRLARSRP